MAGMQTNAANAMEDPAKRGGNRFALFLLFLCFAVNQLDRTIIAFLAVPLKIDLDLSDSEFAIITGPVFSVTYGVFTLFFAYFSDRGDRAKLLFLVLMIWSVASGACGLATSFVQLLIFRLVVGMGEAGGSPTSMALVTDYSMKQQRSMAYAIYVLGAPFGVFSAAVAGSYIAAQFGWRFTFILCGALGLVLAALMRWKLRDPRPTSTVSQHIRPISLSVDIFAGVFSAFRVMRTSRSTIPILLAFSFSYFLGGGMVNWAPIFFNRYHLLSVQDAATSIGIAYCLGIVPGILLGGIVTDRLAKSNPMWPIYISQLGLLLSLPMYFFAYYLADSTAAIIAFGLGIFFSQMTVGPIFVAFNATLPSDIRSMANACILLGAVVISGGVANLLVGLFSDQFSGLLGLASLRVSLILVVVSMTVISLARLIHQAGHEGLA
ncbi:MULTISPECIES: MFS transporter [Sphingobium]|uniref:MFS transporter n=1 Tax=Sphingobium TaxID=165695 RepID=UPI00159C71E7|nr:MFS transporter [Sphingobium sp. 15-1]